jgi:hypothetical protein
VPFQSTIPFILTGLGPQFVFVEFKDTFGNIGGDDRGVYAYDGIIHDPDYVPISTSSLPSTSTIESTTSTSGIAVSTSWYFIDGILFWAIALPMIFLKKKQKGSQN